MTVQIALWILGISLIPTLSWIIWISNQVITTKQLMTQLVGENTKAVKALTHYVVWLAKRDGVNPPPPLENIDEKSS